MAIAAVKNKVGDIQQCQTRMVFHVDQYFLCFSAEMAYAINITEGKMHSKYSTTRLHLLRCCLAKVFDIKKLTIAPTVN